MPTDPHRIATVPNLISFVRLACLPVFLWLLFGRGDRAGAAYLLMAVGATDWVDGYVARHFNQVSELGKVLDPFADRMILIVGVGGIVADGSAPTWFSVVVITREVLVGGALVILTLFGMKRFDVLWVGKAATFGLYFAFPAFLVAAAHNSARTVALVVAWGSAIPSLALSLYSAVVYVPLMARNLAEGRAERGAGEVSV